MKAMLFAAGLGTRLKPFTLNAPKAMAPVNGKPLIQRNIEYLRSFGITDFVINVHHYANQIIDFLERNNHFNCDIEISDETQELLETGGGLKFAEKYLNSEPFLVMNVDILTDLNIKELVNHHKENKALATLAVTERESSRKLLFNENLELCGWKNLKTNEQILKNKHFVHEFAFSGIHIIEPQIFDLFKRDGKFSIIDTYMDLMKTEKICAYNHSGGLLLDVGKPESLRKAEKLFA